MEGQVGQRFGAFEEDQDDDGESVLVDGLYNFAAMSGHFEDLVELPGSSVGTIVSRLQLLHYVVASRRLFSTLLYRSAC